MNWRGEKDTWPKGDPGANLISALKRIIRRYCKSPIEALSIKISLSSTRHVRKAPMMILNWSIDNTNDKTEQMLKCTMKNHKIEKIENE